MTDLVKKYLDVSKYSDQKADFEDIFLSHPNYPSVFAITDSLDLLSIENVAIKVPKEQLAELPESFLAVHKKGLVLVLKTSTSIAIETDKGIRQHLNFNEFLTDWNGVILAIEPNHTINAINRKTNRKWSSYLLPFVTLILLSAVSYSYSLTAALSLIMSVSGLIISVFIVQEKFGVSNEMVSRFCNISANTSCDAVIKSDQSKINKWIAFSDLPLLFFSINVLTILLEPQYSSVIVGLLCSLSIPVILYSVWLQKFKLKKWCVLCLAVSVIVVLQSLVFGFTTTSFHAILSINLFVFLFSAVLIPTIWLFVKPVLEAKMKSENEANELKKFKRNYTLFNFLTEEVPVARGFNQLEGLQVGNADVEVQLTLILSPSCGHCHKAFGDAYALVSKFPQRLSLNILFNINPENNENPYQKVVETLLTIHNSIPEQATEAIIDWHIKKMELNAWVEKWTINTIDMGAHQQIYQQYNWCLANEFNYTPVKIINGKLFPKEYEISELKYFLNDFSKEKELVESISAQA